MSKSNYEYGKCRIRIHPIHSFSIVRPIISQDLWQKMKKVCSYVLRELEVAERYFYHNFNHDFNIAKEIGYVKATFLGFFSKKSKNALMRVMLLNVSFLIRSLM